MIFLLLLLTPADEGFAFLGVLAVLFGPQFGGAQSAGELFIKPWE